MTNARERYDPRYAKRVIERIERTGGGKIYFNDLVVTGRENLHKNENHQRIYVANHLSHADYAFAALELYREGIRMPMIPAGANLDQPLLKHLGLNLGKLGAYFIDRDLMEQSNGDSTAHKKRAIRTTREIMKEGLDLLVFPEGGRSYDGNLFKEYNTGALRSALHNVKDIDIVPIAFAYDHRVEERFLKIAAKGNRKTTTGKLRYYGSDAFAYFFNRPVAKLLGFDVGNAYMNIGEPIPLSEITKTPGLSKREKTETLKKFTIEEIKRLHDEIKTK